MVPPTRHALPHEAGNLRKTLGVHVVVSLAEDQGTVMGEAVTSKGRDSGPSIAGPPPSTSPTPVQRCPGAGKTGGGHRH